MCAVASDRDKHCSGATGTTAPRLGRNGSADGVRHSYSGRSDAWRDRRMHRCQSRIRDADLERSAATSNRRASRFDPDHQQSCRSRIARRPRTAALEPVESCHDERGKDEVVRKSPAGDESGLERGAEIAADRAEGSFDLGGEPFHCRHRTESDDRNDQGVLYEILSVCSGKELLDLEVKCEKRVRQHG
jgi:hypothetical protein